MSPGREADDWNDPRLAEAYAEAVDEGTVYRDLAAVLVEMVAARPGSLVLDLAAGTGAVTGRLAARLGPAGRIVAVDRARAMLAVLARRIPLAEVAALLADPAALPLASRRFDGAVSSAAFWHFPALARSFAELQRVLRPGARLAVNVPAAQLEDVDDLPPPPLMLALDRAGRHRFGRPPAPAGPVLSLARLEALAGQVGFERVTTRVVEVRPTQRELARLAELPAFSARLYPGTPEAERLALVREAERAVDLDERRPLRWIAVCWRAG